jgi:hypothetical protein
MIPVVVDDGRGGKRLELQVDPHIDGFRQCVERQESEPVPLSAFLAARPREMLEAWPEAAVFVFRRRIVELKGGNHVVADVGQRREILLRLKKWVLLKERQLVRLERDVDALVAMVADPAGPRRVPIPRETRLLVFERDRGCCVECGASVDLQFDHIIPVTKGGGNRPDNVQILCGRCNREKSDSVG